MDAPEIASILAMPDSSQSAGSSPAGTLPTAPESSINNVGSAVVKDDNQGSNSPTDEGPETASGAPEPAPVTLQTPVVSAPVQVAPTPLTSATSQPQSSAQQQQTGFIRALLAKANAMIQSHKQKKLDAIVLFAQKKKFITNDDVQKLIRVSDASATRYLVKLVQQGHLARVGSPRDAKYQFVH